MASAAPLLANSPPLARWPGAITVFAAPDIFLQASCHMCSRRHLLLEHIAMGYYPYSELASAPAVKIPSASIGFCLKTISECGPFDIHYARIYVDGVEVSHPELYNDGRYVVHGLHGFLRPLSRTSCVDGSHQHLTARSSAICEAIARLHDVGYSFMALAMHANLGELEQFANLTVFALDDQAIFVGGGRDYVATSRLHVVPGHRLLYADLLRLHAGTLLPTLAGEGQSLLLGAGSSSNDLRTLDVLVQKPDVVINALVAVHGVEAPLRFIRSEPIPLPPVSIKVARGSDQQSPRPAWKRSLAAISAAGFLLLAGWQEKERRARARHHNDGKKKSFGRFERAEPKSVLGECTVCFVAPSVWVAGCCGSHYCSACVLDGYLDRHVWRYCSNPEEYCKGDDHGLMAIGNLVQEVDYPEFFFTGAERSIGNGLFERTFINITDLRKKKLPERLIVTGTHAGHEGEHFVRIAVRTEPADFKPSPTG